MKIINQPCRPMIVILFLTLNSVASAADPAERLQHYYAQGAQQADALQGRALWNSVNNGRSCNSCHGDNPAHAGRHEKTGKLIKPMAFSVNPERYRDAGKIEKWFLRNCKWTLGRQCSVQEKANVLSWLISQ